MIRLRCREEVYEAQLQESSSGLEVRLDGESFRPQVEEVAPGSYVVRNGSTVESFHGARDQGTLHLFWRGVVYRLEEEREGARSGGARHHEGSLEAPMPGKVIKISVAPGQRVAKGEEVLVVEAMKMENALRSPKEGVVKSIATKVGEMVSPGSVLVEIE